MTNTIELRAVSLRGYELRAVNSDTRTVRGICVPYDSPSLPIPTDSGRSFIERIARGAFANSISTDDVLALAHHSQDLVLGRTSAGTLSLKDTSRGIEAEISLPDNTHGKDTYVSIKRGDLRHFSFGFRAMQDRWSNDRSTREVTRGKLIEVSIVASPAYLQTNVAARNLGLAVDSHLGIYGGAPVETIREPAEDPLEFERQRQLERLRLARAQLL